MKAIYIAGKMSGIVNYNFDAFDQADALFAQQGFRVFNPAQMDRDEEGWLRYPPAGFKATKEDKMRFMKRDLAALDQCTHIYMLESWKNSPGAHVELYYAKFLKLEIIYEED